MFWETLWALVIGFGLSGAVQAFVSRREMQRVMGDHRSGTLARASLLGAASSSCSYEFVVRPAGRWRSCRHMSGGTTRRT